ncbi:permease prefix domain 1-containing protein [Kribbella sp. NPDC026611]|uniref:permease prefix domain 1-containing protein n=1 Tax=Kribbella sp. NPDC026611 TaxID=3154911 RepID=UPI0033FCD2E4
MSSTRVELYPVDVYLAALRKALRGPHRRKADLLAEARDHLTDATEALEAEGLSRYDAELEAVADFGELDDVVPGYRAELAVSQGRRTAMLLLLALIIQPIVWAQGVWSWNQDASGETALNAFLQDFVRSVGMVVIAGAVLAVIAAGAGMRYPVVRDHVGRVTGLFALTGSILIGLIGILMTVSNGHLPSLLDISVAGGFVVLPLSFVSLQAARCLRLARA